MISLTLAFSSPLICCVVGLGSSEDCWLRTFSWEVAAGEAVAGVIGRG
jgi:hypothetical protein